ILTNATLLDTAAVKKLGRLGVHELSTSVYSLKPAVHDKITGSKGSLLKVLKTLKEVKKAGISVRIKCALLAENYSEKKALTAFAKKNGYKVLFDPVIAPKNDGSTGNTGNKMGFGALKKIIRQHSGDWFYSKKYLERNVICSAGKNFIAISPYGDVLPCLQIPVAAGNIRKKSLKNIWENSPVLKKIRGMKLKDLKECASCKNICYCNRCPGLALLEGGTLYTKSASACEIASIRAGCSHG
ncbi:MAG: radical SAM protein, partial [Candidatus Firestonebacteria bacterium]